MKISRSQLISLKLSSPQHAQSDEHCNPYLKMLLCLEEKGRMRSLRGPSDHHRYIDHCTVVL